MLEDDKLHREVVQMVLSVFFVTEKEKNHYKLQNSVSSVWIFK